MLPRSKFNNFEEGPIDGQETEADRQLKALVEKQLRKDISIRELWSEKRNFCSSTTQHDVTKRFKGQSSYNQLEEFKNYQEQEEFLQKYKLSEDELKLLFESNDNDNKTKKKRMCDPEVIKDIRKSIMDKIDQHKEDEDKFESFVGAKSLNRHEMDIEKSLYAGTTNNKMKLFQNMLLNANAEKLKEKFNDPMDHLDEIMTKILNRKDKKVKSEEKLENIKDEIHQSIHNALVLVPLEEIEKDRLSIDQIKEVDRFKNYDPGVVSKTLFLKNLHSKVTVEELISLFNHFQKTSEDNDVVNVNYRLLKGRMKGQAFITFPDLESSQKAFSVVNGYKLRGKPIIIQYGKK